jgi:hypothetical protein
MEDALREWLLRKSQNSRVFMCIKELKWELESKDQLHRASVLAIAQLFRERALSAEIPQRVLDVPFDCTRKELLTYYTGLEDLRNLASARLGDTQRNFKRLGLELPQYAVEHAKACNRGLEVWMCTIGAAVVPERRDDVERIWRHLRDAAALVPTAIARLRDLERKIDDRMFDHVLDDVWIASCAFFPSAFVNAT